MNRLDKLFANKNNILNIYTTAGYPKLNDTIEVVTRLAEAGVDMVEIGLPFSDPLADGPTIQNSNSIAIKNGITLDIIFEQIKEIRKTVQIPILLMGYLNQLLNYGVSNFIKKAAEVGVDGLIIPDMPIDYYCSNYKALFIRNNIQMSFLITPQTSIKRIEAIAIESTAFLYVVSSYAITGNNHSINQTQIKYLNKIKKLELKTPQLIGFGIHSKETFTSACSYANGAIIGSAFIKALEDQDTIKNKVNNFIKKLKQ